MTESVSLSSIESDKSASVAPCSLKLPSRRPVGQTVNMYKDNVNHTDVYG